MTSDLLRTHVEGALTALGDQPARVAASLAASGCGGGRREAEGCPVSSYLRQVFGAAAFVSVGPFDVMVNHAGCLVLVRLPAPVQGFVRGFDREEFRGLRHVPHIPPPSHRLMEVALDPRQPLLQDVRRVGGWEFRMLTTWGVN